MSARMDFFEVVKNLHPPNQARKRYDRNYSGTGSDNDNKNLHSPNQARKRYDRNYSGTGSDNDNIPGMHVPSWTNHNNLPKEELPPPNSKSLKHATTAINFSNKFPNEPFFSSTVPPPFAYNEAHLSPRTSAHLHKCPSCDYPLMVQVTADLFYHHVSFIPAAMAKRNNETYDVNNFVNDSQHLSHGGRTQQYSPVLEPEEEEEEEVSTLSNEQTEMMVTAPSEKPQQGFRTYASITAGNNIDSKEDDNPLVETDDNAHQKVGLGQVEAQVIVNDKAKETISAPEVENTTSSQVDNGGDGDDDASNDGFTTVVSWKSKIRAKAAAKAKEAAAHGYGRGKNRFGKHGRGSTREEHNKNVMMGPRDEQHDKNDGGPKVEHDKRGGKGLIKDGHDKHGRRGPRDEHIKHGAGDQKEDCQDKHGRDEHNTHGTGDRDPKEDAQNKHVRAPWDKRDNYGEFPRERNDKFRGFPREEHTPQRERGQPRRGK